MVVCFSNTLTWQKGKLALYFGAYDVFRYLLGHEIRKFGTLWEVVGNSDHVFFYLKETKAKHSFVQRAPISKLKYLKGNQPSQNGPWQRLSHKAKKETRRTQGRQFHAALWES